MKTTIYLFVGVLLLLVMNTVSSQDISSKNTDLQQGTITISCSPDLYPLASRWVSEYASLKPGVKIKVNSMSDKNINLDESENLSFVFNKSKDAVLNESDWKMVLGRDVIVPVINDGNPYMAEILRKGISQEMFVQIFNNPDKQNWSTVLGNGQNSPMHIYMINDEVVKGTVANFLKSTQIPTERILLQTKEKVVMALQNDPYAIGFCNVINIMGLDNQGLAGNLKLLPIDKNGNGTIDYMEDIYSDPNTLFRGVWIGKYPKTLYSNIYAISKMPPTKEAEIAFLSWVLTDGQQYLNANGYSDLTSSESQSQLEKFNVASINIQSKEKSSNAGLVLLIVAMFITLGVIVSAGVRRYRKQVPAVPEFNDSLSSFDESGVKVPKGIYFDRSHTWAFMEKDGNVSIGIDDFLQHITGPITRVDMKNPGEKIKKGDLLFSIVQFGKQLSLYAPVSGTIKKQNEALFSDASKMNSSPYTDGWVYMIEPTNWFKEIQFMEMAEKYKKWIDTEFSRVKDFLAATLKPESLEYSHVVMQDGGLLKDGILADFGPEVWEDFQTNFLDNYK